jgi:DNA-binding winged helix-turn-helix (wHTH) protein/tetratricopeptide (TPR) repeat protein
VRARFDAFELDEVNARLLRDGKPLALAPTPFALLCALVRQPGVLLAKHKLLDDVWGHQFVSDSVLKTAISDLRTVLGDHPKHPRLIETVPRRGYRFIAATTAIAAATAAQADAAGSEPPDAAPFAPALAPTSATFIGRTHALSRLRRAWDLARGGKRTVVWVAGEPGIGKSALIEHFAAHLGDAAAVRGQCVESYGAGEPYLPVLEALGELCRRDSTVPALLRTVAPAWLLQLPWLCTVEERDALRRELAGVSPDRMLREMGELFDRYTERRPLLLVTEDLHWSDRATIQLIDYIARRRGAARLMWLASFRLAEVVAQEHPLSSLRHELRLHGLCEEIVLDPFSEQEVADYVSARAAALAGDTAFVHALHERTDGVPLFVASVINDALAIAPRQDDADGVSRFAAQFASVAVPENLAAIIDHHIAKLGNEQRALLCAAAVCGVEFRATTLAETLERDAVSVGQMCEELAREQMWLQPPRAGAGSDAREPPYAFRHALFRQVLYERAPLLARTHLHGKVGAALERERAAGLPVAAGELAMHFDRAREPMTALRYYAEAAEAALAHASPADCISLTERAFDLLDRAPAGTGRSALEIALAALRGVAAVHVLGFGNEAKSAFQRAYSLLAAVPQHPMRGLLLHGFGFVLAMRSEYAEALAVAERAAALPSAANDPVLELAACFVQAEVHQLQGRPRAARTWVERGLAAAEPLDVAPGETFVADPQVTLLGQLGIQLLHFGLVEQARERLRQARARAHQIRQPMARLVASWHDALLEVRLGNAERVAALADEMQALVDEFALAQGRIAYRSFRGWADARMGKPREGYRRIREAYDEDRRLGMLAGVSELLGYAAEALVLDGDWDAAQAQLEEALRVANTCGERVYLPQLLLTEAAIARARGQSAAAKASVRRALAEARAQESSWLELLVLLDLCEHDGAGAADRRALAALVDRLPEAIDTTAFKRARALLG